MQMKQLNPIAPMTQEVEGAIEQLRKLIAFKVFGGESNLEVSNYIEEVFGHNTIPYHRVPNKEGNKVSLHCRIGPAVEGGTILSGHMDVVPVEGQPWTKPAFQLTQEDQKLFGRGTADMKGFVACCLAMLPFMQDAPLIRPIYFAFSYDEEIGCLSAPALIQDMKTAYEEKPSHAIIGEPTGMKTTVAEKGICVFTTHIQSTAAHSSEVRKSVSAITEATVLIEWLKNKMEALLNQGSIDNRFDPPYTTIHVGTIQGGTAVNIVADSCTFEWDVRNIPADRIEAILADFQVYCQEREKINTAVNPDFKINTTAKFPIVPSLDTPLDASIVDQVNDWSDTTETGTVSFGSEAGQYSNAGYQAVLCGPGDMAQGHRADEFVAISQLEKCIFFLKKLVISHCNP